MKYTIDVKNTPDSVQYTVAAKGIEIKIDCRDEGSLFIIGPKEILQKVVAGRGEEDKHHAWIGDKEIKSEADSASIILELLMHISEQ